MFFYLDIRVDLGVEENQEAERDDPDGHEPEPVEVDRVVRVGPEIRRLQHRKNVRL